MTLTEAEKKRKQRERAKRGSPVIMVELMDRDAWLEILRDEGLLRGVETDLAVRLATETFIWELCRDYQREQAQVRLADIRAPVTGLLDRETQPVAHAQLIKAKDVKRPGPDLKPRTYFDDLLDAPMDELTPSEAEGTVAEGGFQIRDE